MKTPRRLRLFSWQRFLPLLILACVSVLTYLVLVQPWSLRQTSLPLAVGDVTPQDLRAPRDVQYVSEVLTEQARSQAERAVAPVYGPPDATIARAQVEELNTILAEISAIRNEDGEEVSEEQKKVRLLALRDGLLRPDSVGLLLALSEERWYLVRVEALDLLDTVMQAAVRSEDLENVRQGLLARVSYTLTRFEAGLVVELVSPLLAANSFYSPELTDAARRAGRDSVQPVTRSYVEGQTVAARGQVVSEVDLEALTILGLVQPQNPLYSYIGAAALVAISATFAGLYFYRRQRAAGINLRGLLLLVLLFLAFFISARVVIPNRTVIPYLFPLPALALLVTAMFGVERGLVFALLGSLLTPYGLPDSQALMPYYMISSLCGILALGDARRVGQFLYAAVAVAAAGIAMVAAYRLPFTETDWFGLVTLAGAAVFMGLASTGLALPLHYLLSQFIGQTTALQLLEISRPDSPLLNYFLQRAPGTYQHSLQVANLAEQAAERIGADALLTRVGALFHDVGKAANPLFFVENQPPSQIDSHDDWDPKKSAAVIISHVTEGVKVARRYRLPRRLHDFILEHHGTLITRYQYNRALEAAGGDASKVSETKFRYPGPPPRSKETALMMFADGVEARARAERPETDEEVRALVRSVIETCRKAGQLEDTPLSQRDLAAIVESFTATLRVTYHPRLEYPKEQPDAGQEQAASPVQEPGKPR